MGKSFLLLAPDPIRADIIIVLLAPAAHRSETLTSVSSASCWGIAIVYVKMPAIYQRPGERQNE